MDSSIASASPSTFDGLHPSTPRSMAEAVAWIAGLAARVAPCGILAACFSGDGDRRLRKTLVLNASYPRSWMGWYLATRADRLDPVLRQALTHTISFAWRGEDAADLAGCTEEFLRAAAGHGIEAGAIATHLGVDARCTIVAVAGAREYPYNAWVPHLLLRAQLAHAGLAELARIQETALPFTEQQVRILHALRMGLQDHEIAALLKISSETIRKHFTRLMRRTGLCRFRALALLDEWQPLSVIPHRTERNHIPPWQFPLFE
jgi:DNA-binding CsgD family transcriptional regulator